MKAWVWIKARAVALLAGALGLAIGCIVWLRQSSRARLLDVRTAEQVARAQTKIAQLQAVRDTVLSRVDETDEMVKTIDLQLVANQRLIVAAFEKVEGLTDDEVRDRFSALGY